MTRLGRAAFTLLPLCVGLASAASARAEEAETVWLVLPDCTTPPYDPDELSRSLEVELAPYHLRARVRAADSMEPGTTVSVGLPRCDADGRWLTLQYGDAIGRRSRKRALSLRDVPKPARARMLALVIAYALRPTRSLDDEKSAPETPAPETSAPEELPQQREALAPATADPVRADTLDELPIRNFPFPLESWTALATRDAPFADGGAPDSKWLPALPGRLRVGASVEFRLLTAPSDLLFGIELNLRGQLIGRSEWAIEGAHSGGTTGKTDAVDVDWWKVAMGVDYPLTSAPSIRLGPRLMLARIEGSRVDASDLGVSVISAGGRASFSAEFKRRANLELQFEVDHSLYAQPLSASLPWYGWVMTWGAGLSFDI